MRALLEGDYERGEEAAQAVIAWERARGGARPVAHARSMLQYHAACDAAAPQRARRARPADAASWSGWSRPGRLAGMARRRSPGRTSQAGRPELARAEIEAMSADGFAAVPRDSNFLTRLAQVAHAIGELGDAELAAAAGAAARAVRRVLGRVRARAPRRSGRSPTRSACSGFSRTGRTTRSRRSSRRSSCSERMRARPYVARSRAGLAEALRRRAGPGDAARAERALRPGGRRRRARSA